MAKKKVLFITQKLPPYLDADPASVMGGRLPQKMTAQGCEVRTFMPKFGAINERRNQLHEVIRLSGMNIAIRENDHPLIIKVASLQPARIQVYFIDNDDYFLKNDDDEDTLGSNRTDNDERTLFFARGTSETVRKLRWEPSIIHIAGWFSALLPLYFRKVFGEDPAYKDAKIIYSVLPGDITGGVDQALFDKLVTDGVPEEAIAKYRSLPHDVNLYHRMAIDNADAVIFNTPEIDDALVQCVKDRGIPMVKSSDFTDSGVELMNFYKTINPA